MKTQIIHPRSQKERGHLILSFVLSDSLLSLLPLLPLLYPFPHVLSFPHVSSLIFPGILQKAFAGKTTAKDKILQIITSNLTVSVIGNTVYLICMAYINGARGIDRISKAVKASWWPIMRITWTLSPVLLGTAQNFLAPELWEPFFTFSRFILSTYFK